MHVPLTAPRTPLPAPPHTHTHNCAQVYDGAHTHTAQKLAITHFWEALADASVLVIDDWNWRDARTGTFDGLRDVGAVVLFQAELRMTWNEEHTSLEAAHAGFWNGMAVFVVAKPQQQASA